jgi:sterol desaturase/sphingolipid hydroxylase (fatty acid hydroxylase superfamily)
MEALANWFSDLQAGLFEAVVEPLAFALGLGHRLADAYSATGWLLVGLLQLAVLLAIIGPLQRWRPVEAVTDRATIRTDVLYTLIHRLGLFRLALFFTLTPLMDDLFGLLRVAGLPTWHLDDLWPGVTDQPLVSLLLYLLAFDFLDYWIHRGQHRFEWWWRLHALHHAQRQMTMWSDNRNHLLDDLLRDVIVVTVAQLIGVAPAQFVAIVALTQLSESFQHANLRLSFGRWGERLWISPRFHRVHHSIGIGHESPATPSKETLSAAGPSQGARAPGPSEAQGRPARGGSEDTPVPSVGAVKLGGHNFGVLLPWWDMLFGTANFELRYDPTGVRDQVEQGRDYGRGFWSQQWLGLKRLVGRA